MPTYEVTSRVIWATSLIVFVFVTVVCSGVLLSCSVRWLLGEQASRSSQRFGLAAILGVGCILCMVGAWRPRYEFVLDIPLHNALRQQNVDVNGILNFANGLSAIITFLLFVGACAAIHGPDIGEPATTAAVDRLVEQGRRLQLVLYLASAALVTGVVEVTAYYSWGQSFFVDPTRALKPDTFASAAGGTAGAFFSLLLAATYVPAWYVLHKRSNRLAAVGVVAGKSEWLEDQGLSLSIPRQLAAMVALLGPVLVSGPFNSLHHLFGAP